MKKKQSLLFKILMPFLIIILLTGSFAIYITYTSTYKSIEKEKNEAAKGVTRETAALFDVYFKEVETEINQLAQNEKIIHALENKPNAIQELKKVQDSHNYLYYTYMVLNDDKSMISSPKMTDLSTKDYNPVESPWYKDAVKNKNKVVWIEPYQDMVTNEMLITANKAVFNGDKLVGVLSLDIKLSKFAEIINNIHIGDNGYISIHDTKGTLIFNHNKDVIGKNFKNEEFVKKPAANSNSEGQITYTFKGIEKEAYFVKENRFGWTLLGIIPIDDFKNVAVSMVTPIIISLVAALLVTITIMGIIIRQTLKPVKELTKSMELVEKGNLQVYVEPKTHDEIGQLTKSFNDMITRFRSVIHTIEFTSKEVKDASEILINGTEENTRAISEISSTMEEISNGSNEQADLSKQNNEKVNELSTKIETIDKQSVELKEDSHLMFQATNKGAENIKVLREQSQKTNDMTNNMVGAIHSLDKNSVDISEIINTMTEIAEQTNLLALNASIEAARAGEHGRGFAVVADEVRKLAEKSASSSKEIAELIQKMQNETKNTVKLIESTHDLIKQQDGIVNTTEESFVAIADTIVKNSNMIEEISQNIGDMLQIKNQLVSFTDTIHDITEKHSESTQEVSASVEEQMASMEQLHELSEKLANHAEKLTLEFEQFKK